MSYHVNEKAIMVNLEAYIPEMLYQNVEELHKIFKTAAAEFDSLLRICRTPYSSVFCRALVKNTTKETCHAHKINNTIGQILLASVWVKLVLSLKLVLDSTVLQQQQYVL
jgi:tryptophan synthase beta subunit